MKHGTPEFIEHMKRIGSLGGKAKVPKGFAKFSKTKLRAATRKGGKARHDKFKPLQDL